jgi:hemerythrin-like domain-containing protein
LAKKATRKKTTTARKATSRKTSARRVPPKRRTAPKRTAPKKPSRKVARRKTAARAAASRKRQTQPKPKQTSAVAKAATAAKGVVAGAVKAVAERLPWSRTEPDAIEMLEREHRQFEGLLKQGEDTTDRAKKTRREVLSTLTAGLNEHELMEEKVLYPALQSHGEARETVLEGYEEHHVADLIVKELHDVAEDDEQWAAKFKVLKENIEHHIQEEERVMFPTARGLFSREELLAMAARMRGLRAGAK